MTVSIVAKIVTRMVLSSRLESSKLMKSEFVFRISATGVSDW